MIQRLTTELGLNLAGVEHVLRLEDELRRQRARAERLERELREEIRTVHRSYKREIVLYQHRPDTPQRGTDGFQQADDQEPGGGRRSAGARAPHRQSRALPRASAAGAARPGARPAARARLRPRSAPRRRRSCARSPRSQGASQQPAAGAAFSRVLDAAFEEARKLEDDYVSTEHLLLALDAVPREELLARIKEVRGGQRVTSQDPEGTYQALSKFGRDLTEAAEQGKLDPVVGRDEEIRRVIQVLSRRTKNNPVLIGEPGVGKTAIAEGLAQRIVAGDVPEGLKGKRVWALDVGALLAGREVPRRVRGAAEGRPRRDQERRRPDRPLHRRAAHDRRRRRGRGRGRRGADAEADARPRRAAHRRRDHARRVPQAHREGRRARAPLPARLRRRAVRRGHDRDPARAEGEVRVAPPRPDPRRGARRRRGALRPLHRRPAAARQGDRPRRRGRLAPEDGDRQLARSSSTRPTAPCASSRSSSRRWARSRRTCASRSSASSPTRRSATPGSPPAGPRRRPRSTGSARSRRGSTS